MFLHSRNGIRGLWIDLDTGQPIRKVIWGDTESGLFEAYQVDEQGEIKKDNEGNYLTYRAKGRLRFEPAKPITKPTPPATSPPRQKVEHLHLPLFSNRCSHKGCDRVADWSVSDEIEQQPEIIGGMKFARGKVVARHYYCAFHYRPPRLLHPETGDVLQVFEEAYGVRPKWHS